MHYYVTFPAIIRKPEVGPEKRKLVEMGFCFARKMGGKDKRAKILLVLARESLRWRTIASMLKKGGSKKSADGQERVEALTTQKGWATLVVGIIHSHTFTIHLVYSRDFALNEWLSSSYNKSVSADSTLTKREVSILGFWNLYIWIHTILIIP